MLSVVLFTYIIEIIYLLLNELLLYIFKNNVNYKILNAFKIFYSKNCYII